jgi:hypothetical protein
MLTYYVWWDIHTAVLLHGGQELNKEDLVKLLGSDMPGVST